MPTCFVFPGLDYGEYVTEEEYLRAAFKALKAGGDAVWCAASLQIIRRLRDEGVPVCGHVGLIPPKRTWTGGFKAVGKTLDTALLVWRQTKALEEAGAFSAEIEVVPADVASAISKRTSLFMISMGAGAGCDAQYLFATDVLGTNRGHVPRHSKVYRNLAAEYDRLQHERIAAFVGEALGGEKPDGVLVVVGGPPGRWLAPADRMLKAMVLGRFVKQRIIPFVCKTDDAGRVLLAELTQAGMLSPVIDREYALRDTPEAVRYVGDGHPRGKVVIKVR